MSDFDHFGITDNQLPSIKYSYSGKIIIVAGGWCVWEDLSQIDFQNYDIMCVNDIYMHFPGDITHFYSNDHRWMPRWINARRELHKRAYTKTTKNHTNRFGDFILWPWPGHGTSGLNAIYTAIGLGYDEIVLAGMPLDNGGHYFDPRPYESDGSWGNRHFSNFINEVPEKSDGMKYWQNAKQHIFKDRVRSLSGRTKDLLE